MREWPLIHCGPGRSELIYGFESIVVSQHVFSVEGVASVLERLEAALGRGKPPIGEDLALLRNAYSGGEDGRRFLGNAHAIASEAGGMRVQSPLRQLPHLAPLALPGLESDWTTDFTLVCLSEPQMPDPSRPSQTKSPSQKERVLVFHNPLGEALPNAQEEAEAIADVLFASSDRLEVEFVARPLNEHELYSALSKADALFYTGHAQTISGQPAIPFADGWSPLLTGSPLFADGPELVALFACLPGGATLRLPGSHTMLYPLCRIADRANAFSLAFVQAYASGAQYHECYRWACSADRQAQDLRRYVYRLQGGRLRSR